MKRKKTVDQRTYGQGFYWVDGIGLFLIDPDGDLHRLTTDMWPAEDAYYADDSPADWKAFKETAAPLKPTTDWL